MAQKDGRGRRARILGMPAAALEKGVKALELTPDVLPGMAHLEFFGNREALIEGCCSILQYDENVIRISAGRFVIRFTGQGLSLRNLRHDSAVIEGEIASVEFTG